MKKHKEGVHKQVEILRMVLKKTYKNLEKKQEEGDMNKLRNLENLLTDL